MGKHLYIMTLSCQDIQSSNIISFVVIRWTMKVLALASCAGISIKTMVKPQESGNTDFDSSQTGLTGLPIKSMYLRVENDSTTIHLANSMIRFLASLVPSSGLLGQTQSEKAQINSWLTFLWHNVELPMHALTQAHDDIRVADHIQVKLGMAFKRIDSYLQKQSNLVGSSTTLADICLAVVLDCYVRGATDSLHDCANLREWHGSWKRGMDGESFCLHVSAHRH